MSKVRIGTAWLGGCSGCHMSFLDLDERLVQVAPLIDIVYGPLVDTKEYPENVDVALVEGAIIGDENIHLLKIMRERSKLLIALGDCAVTGNVPGMRNLVGREAALNRAYVELPTIYPQVPHEIVTSLVKKVNPIHRYVKVDIFVPGCPPSPDRIFFVLSELLAGRMPVLDAANSTFG
jgi:NAD-reducing hydrogenase small subunit